MKISGDMPGKIDLGAMFGKSLEGKGVDKLEKDISMVLDGDNLRISYNNPVTGAKLDKTITIPDFAIDGFEADVANFLDELADQFDAIAEELKIMAAEMGDVEDGDDVKEKGDKTKDSSGLTKAAQAFMTIYDLINLMQQLAQTQRNNAREIRFGELEAQIASIKSQAEHQRSGALCGLIAGVITGIVQVGLVVGTTIAGAKGLAEQSKTASGQQLEQANIDVKTLEAANQSPEAAKANVDELSRGVDQRTINKVDAEMASIENDPDVKTASANVEKAQDKLAALEKAKRENTATIEFGEGDAKQVLTVNDKAIEDAKAELTTAKNELDAAKIKALDNLVAGKDEAYNAKASETKAAEDKYLDERSHIIAHKNIRNFKPVDRAREAQAQLGEERALLKAKVAEMKANIQAEAKNEGRIVDTGLKKDLHTARLAQKDAKDAHASDRTTIFLNQQVALCQGLQQLQQTIGALGQGIGSYLHALEESKGTEEQAKQKELEQFRDETNQLFQQAQEVVNNVRSLLQAIIQAEAQSNDQIIRA